MQNFTTPAILLRRIDHGDDHLIVTLFTRAHGKTPAVAKSAKKSIKRFGGILELFYVLDVVCRPARKRGLAILEEATLIKPFAHISGDVKKTAYASYWSEVITEWLEDGIPNIPLFDLLKYGFDQLDRGHISAEVLSIVFQMRLMALSGYSPNLTHCTRCHVDLRNISDARFTVDVPSGGLVCAHCRSKSIRPIAISKGTIKQLLWIASGDLNKAGRIRFSSPAIEEALRFLETFVPYHLGRCPRSLKFLKQIRIKH